MASTTLAAFLCAALVVYYSSTHRKRRGIYEQIHAARASGGAADGAHLRHDVYRDEGAVGKFSAGGDSLFPLFPGLRGAVDRLPASAAQNNGAAGMDLCRRWALRDLSLLSIGKYRADLHNGFKRGRDRGGGAAFHGDAGGTFSARRGAAAGEFLRGISRSDGRRLSHQL